MKILAINPGSTSTKIAVYEYGTTVCDDRSNDMASSELYSEFSLIKSIPHSPEDLARFEKVSHQYDWRKELIHKELESAGYKLDFDAVVGRGSLAKPVEGGVYIVSQKMVDDAKNAEHQHACDLGCILAYDIASEIPGCLSLTADPGVVDELCDYARISGSPHCERICIWHALNQRATARKYAKAIGKRYEDLNLIVCHLGGGISVAAHEHGRAVDANNALDGEGPFSPERAGSLPAASLINLCFSGKYTQDQLLKRIAGHAGLQAHLGTTNVIEIERRIKEGDKKAELVLNAMIYHVAKAIAAEGAVLYGKVDAILITGGMARSNYVVERIIKRVEYMAPVRVFPGENEMEALVYNAGAVLRGEIEAKQYE